MSTDIKKRVDPITEVRTTMTAMESQFKLALPPHIPADRFIRVVMTAIQTNPDLLTLERQSLFGACMKAAQDGLLPDGKEAALVPFKGKVQYMPMVTGILKKVRNSGDLSTITSQIVRAADKFRYWVDADGEHIEHEPLMFGDRGKPIGVYALAKTKDGSSYIEIMTADQVQDVRDVSQAKSGPWNGPFEGEMWRKTAIRRLSKRLPMSTDMEQVIQRDDEMYDFSRTKQVSQEKAQQLSHLIGSDEPKEGTEAKTSTTPGPINFDDIPG